MESVYIEAGMRIRQLREKQGWTREDLAAVSGISPKFLYEIENGKKGFSAQTLSLLAKCLHVSCDYIMFGI